MERWGWGASETLDALETVPWIGGGKEDIDAPFPSPVWKDAAAEAVVVPRGDGDETEVTALVSIAGRPSSSPPCTSSLSCRSSLGGAASRLRGDTRWAAIVGRSKQLDLKTRRSTTVQRDASLFGARQNLRERGGSHCLTVLASPHGCAVIVCSSAAPPSVPSGRVTRTKNPPTAQSNKQRGTGGRHATPPPVAPRAAPRTGTPFLPPFRCGPSVFPLCVCVGRRLTAAQGSQRVGDEQAPNRKGTSAHKGLCTQADERKRRTREGIGALAAVASLLTVPLLSALRFGLCNHASPFAALMRSFRLLSALVVALLAVSHCTVDVTAGLPHVRPAPAERKFNSSGQNKNPARHLLVQAVPRRLCADAHAICSFASGRVQPSMR
jgi:hypothetical protein